MSTVEKGKIENRHLKPNIKENITRFAMIIELVGVFILFQILTDGIFLSSLNLSNLLLQGCTISILGIGMLWVMVSGGIDLSAGALLGFLANFAATIETLYHVGTIETILLTLVLGTLIGCSYGYLIAYRGIPAFIVTLAGQLIFKGLTLWVGGGMSRGPVSQKFSLLGRGYLTPAASVAVAIIGLLIFVGLTIKGRCSDQQYGLPVLNIKLEVLKLAAVIGVVAILMLTLLNYKGIAWAVLLLVVMAAIFTFLSNDTTLGRSIYALGGNRDAARLSGINIARTELKVYAFMGFITALASVVFLGRVGQATAQVGNGFEFDAITGCIVGGTSTLGGAGTVVGAIIGTMLMASLDNGMSLMNLDSTIQYIVKGAVLLLAVSIDVSSKKKSA